MIDTQALKIKMIQAGLNGKKAAALMNMRPEEYSRKINNGRRFTPAQIIKLCHILKITPEEIGSIFFTELKNEERTTK